MHIGNAQKECPTLQVNQLKYNNIMAKVKEDTYLGGLLSDSCDNERKLELALNKGIGIVSGIMAILQLWQTLF